MGKEYNLEEPIWETEKWCIFSPSEGAQWHYHQGCAEPLKEWIKSSGDTLFVIGFCVIAFLKLTFLGILHYEIKEMIQKIQNLQKETQQMNGDLLRLVIFLEYCILQESSTFKWPQGFPEVLEKLKYLQKDLKIRYF